MRVKLFISILYILFLLHYAPWAFAQTSTNESFNTPQSTIILWTDGPKLKAVNIIFFPNHTGPLGIVSIPIYACPGKDITHVTVADYYLKYGREKLILQLQELFGTPIETYITIDQRTLVDASKLVGTIQMAGVNTNLVNIFDGRYIDHPVNLQVEIRQLAGAITTPVMLLKLPQMIWIFATQVDTTIKPGQFLNFYKLLSSNGPGVLQKKAVPGYDININNRKYRLVEPDAWVKTMQEVTTRE